MKIYTKTGDKGKTSLVGGKRVFKNDSRLEAYGNVDELNSFLGLLRSKLSEGVECERILSIQNTLFRVGAHLATDVHSTELSDAALVGEPLVLELESWIDEYDNSLPKLTNFIIYGEDEVSALAHVCRAVCRRTERSILTVYQENGLDDAVLRYMNRLSDFLFIFARIESKKHSEIDFFWKK